MNTSIGVSNTVASVIAYRTTVFPSFWLSEYAHSIDWSVQSAVEVAATHLHLTDYSFLDAIALASVISPNLDERRCAYRARRPAGDRREARPAVRGCRPDRRGDGRTPAAGYALDRVKRE